MCRFPADADEKAALTEACLDAHVLKQADGVEGAQAPGSAYYFMGGAADQYYSPPREYAATFSLPEGLACDGASAKCVLQMYYITGECSCWSASRSRKHPGNQPTNQPPNHSLTH